MNSPAPLFHGKSEQYGWVVVTEWIANAPTVREVWDKTTDPAKRRELLCTVSRELAKYHSKGVLQKDLHLGNFLLQKGRLFGLDPSEMRFLGGEADKRRSIWQLALLGSVVPEEDSDTIAEEQESKKPSRNACGQARDIKESKKTATAVLWPEISLNKQMAAASWES
jgi:hypothetical protein